MTEHPKTVIPGYFFTIEKTSIPRTKKRMEISLEKFRERNLFYKLSAEEASWTVSGRKWVLKRYFSRELSGPMKENSAREKDSIPHWTETSASMEDIEEVSS